MAVSLVVHLAAALCALQVWSLVVRRSLHRHGLGRGRRSVEVAALAAAVLGNIALLLLSPEFHPAVRGATIGVAAASLVVPGMRLVLVSRLRRVLASGPWVEILDGPIPEWPRDLVDSAADLGFTTLTRFRARVGNDFVCAVRPGADHWLNITRAPRRPGRSLRSRPTLVVISATANGGGLISTSAVPQPLATQRNVLAQWAPDLTPRELIDRHTALLGHLVDRGVAFTRPADPATAEAADGPSVWAMVGDIDFERRLCIGVSDAFERSAHQPDDAETEAFISAVTRPLRPPPPPPPAPGALAPVAPVRPASIGEGTALRHSADRGDDPSHR